MPLEYQHHKLSWIGVMGAQPRSVPATARPSSAGSFSTGDNQTFKRAIDMTDDELAAIASGATLHVVK